MNILLVPNSASKGRSLNVSARDAILLGALLLVLLPAAVGIVAYHASRALDTLAGRASPALREQEEKLLAQEQAILAARLDAETNLNALAHKLGLMQAQLVRLNALGDRLVQMAKLDRREFDFSAMPGLGGPEAAVSIAAASVPDFLQAFDRIAAELDQRTAQMGALETLLLDRKLLAAVHPDGWPTRGGWISSTFGSRSDPFNGHTVHHDGVDIAAEFGAPIVAMGAGMVSYAGPRDGYGLAVEINHGRGITTRYAHASAILVHVGDRIEKGQSIARVGSSGRSTGPHLHFEVLRDGRAVNPQSYLRTAAARSAKDI
jgi:murein DD-endopeptidase MepM/ murein hydrolase activator NlpD